MHINLNTHRRIINAGSQTNTNGTNNIDSSYFQSPLGDSRPTSDLFDINLIDFRPASRRYIFNNNSGLAFSRHDMIDNERADFSFADIIRYSLDRDEEACNSDDDAGKKVSKMLIRRIKSMLISEAIHYTLTGLTLRLER
jgi:hypothetical protein